MKTVNSMQVSFNCSHRNTNYLIVGLSLYKSNCMMALGNEKAAMILNTYQQS